MFNRFYKSSGIFIKIKVFFSKWGKLANKIGFFIKKNKKLLFALFIAFAIS